MGNTAVVASGVKNQGDAEASKLYQLVGLKGGGELVELMKAARWTKNYAGNYVRLMIMSVFKLTVITDDSIQIILPKYNVFCEK